MKFKRNWRTKLAYKSQLIGIKNIEKRNKKFHSLEKKERRMEIALDVIDMLNRELISNNRNGYISGNVTNLYMCDTSKELQAFTLNDDTYESWNKCEVCARGAMMLSTVRMGNELDSETFSSMGDSDTQKHYTSSQYRDMEIVYENDNLRDTRNASHYVYEYPYLLHSNEILANIFLQVVQTGGKFKVSNTVDYLKLIK